MHELIYEIKMKETMSQNDYANFAEQPIIVDDMQFFLFSKITETKNQFSHHVCMPKCLTKSIHCFLVCIKRKRLRDI